jgi:hypothetical protein
MEFRRATKLCHRRHRARVNRAVALAFAWLLWLSLPPSRALAQSDAAVPTGYREAVDEGLAEMELKNFEEAGEQFRRAHALYPNARTLRGLGFVERPARFDLPAVAIRRLRRRSAHCSRAA